MSEEMRCAEGYDCPEGPDGACCGNPRLETYATRQAPKVKALEWVTFDACTMWADTIVGTWHINSGQGGGFTFKLGSNPIIYTDENGDEWSEWPSIEAAKAAAQADYARRILSALED